jgi:hypothetical protein
MKNSSANSFWHTVNELLGRTEDSGTQILSPDGSFMKAEEAVQGFADFFRDKVLGFVSQNPILDAEVEFDDLLDKTLPFSSDELVQAMSIFKPKKIMWTR